MYHNNGIVTMVPLTQEELECVRVCVSNAPIPYDITKKKIPADILQKIGQPRKAVSYTHLTLPTIYSV